MSKEQELKRELADARSEVDRLVKKLDELVNEMRTGKSPGDDVIDIKECSKRLNLSDKALYDAVGRGELPGAFRVGGAIRVHWPTLINSGSASTARGRRSRKRSSS